MRRSYSSIRVLALLISSFVFLVLMPRVLVASVTNGTVDSTNKYAKGLDDNVGSINFGLSAGNVHVTDSAVTGYAWGEKIGWINLTPPYGGVGNNNEGTLSGYAWGELTGWINFAPTNGGVVIDSSGSFTGYAWSQNFGWIIFNCATNSSCATESFKVSTDWLPRSARPQCNNSQDDDSDGNIDYPDDIGCDSLTDTAESSAGTGSGSSGGGGSSGSGSVIPPTDGDAPTLGEAPPVEGEVPPAGPPQEEVEVTPTPSLPPETEPSSPPPVAEAEPSPGGAVPPPSVFETGGGFGGGSGVLSFIQDQIQESYSSVTESLETFREETKRIIESPAGSVVAKTTTVIGVTVNVGVGLTALFLSPISVSEIVFIPLRLWSLLLAAFGLKRKNRPWGTVYDSVTKQPLDPAYVSLYDESGKEVKGSITDLDGRYGFLSASGRYRVQAGKTHYRFPSTKMAGRMSDVLYRNLYFGENIAIEGAGDVITKNIPMDQEGFDWNEFTKRQKKLTRFFSSRDVWVARITGGLFYAGFAVSLIALVSAPVIYNILIFLLYVAIAILRKEGLKPKVYGMLTERGSGLPLSFAVIRVISEAGDQISRTVCDEYGRYYCLVPPGEYQIKVEKKIGEELYSLVYLSPRLKVKNGIINERLAI